MKIISLLLLFFCETVYSQLQWPYKVDSLIDRHIGAHQIDGIAVGIVFNDTIQYIRQSGNYLDMRKQEIKGEAPFLTASISKVFVASAIMQLHEKNLLDLDEKITHYLPEFKMKDDNYKLITIRHLLNHKSGLTEGNSYIWDRKINEKLDIRNCVLSLNNKKLLFKPGEKFNYSNVGYVILGYIIEKITERNFNTYMKEEIFVPLKMVSSSFDKNDFNNLQNYYDKKGRKRVCCQTNLSPSGNLLSTVNDLCNWMLYNLQLHHDKPMNVSIISKESQNLLWMPTQTFRNSKTTFGLGWWQYHTEKYGTSVFHSGHYSKYAVSNLVLFPEHNFGFVILCNSEAALKSVHIDLTDDLTELIYGLTNTK